MPATPSGRGSSLGQSTSTNVDTGVRGSTPGEVGPQNPASGYVDTSTSTDPSAPTARAITPPPPPPPKPVVVTYSKGVQTSDVAVGPGPRSGDEDAGNEGAQAGGSGRETEDEMRKRILEEINRERRALEDELREIKDKEQKLAGECASPRTMSIGHS